MSTVGGTGGSGTQKRPFRQRLLMVCLALAVLLLTAEGVARYGLGLGTPLLYERDALSGYRVVPNQDIYRFGHHIIYNAQGLRSPAMTPLPTAGTTRILCVGDSITYGGAQANQAKTYPYLLQEGLRHSRPNYEVLNASAGGWAPDNELGFLRGHGIYGSQIVVLEIGTNDLFQDTPTESLLDKNVSFPTQRPLCALQDGFSRYFLPKYLPRLVQSTDPGVNELPSEQLLWHDLMTIRQMIELVQRSHAQPVIMYMEMPDGFKPQYPICDLGRAKLLQMAAAMHVPVLLPDAAMERAGGKKMFRDEMHPNEAGNAVIAESLEPLVENLSRRPK